MLLARAGFAPTVYDARPVEAARADRRLLALSRGTWQVLEPLLGTRALPIAPIIDVHVSSAGEFGTTLLRATDLDRRTPEPLGATVFYGDLVTALAAAAQDEPGVTLRRPLKIERVLQRFDAVELQPTADAAGTASTTQSALTDTTAAAARGAALAIHAEGSPAGQAGATRSAPTAWAITGELSLRGPQTGTAFERFTREGPLALLPAPAVSGNSGPRWSLVWCMDEAQAQRRGALGDAAFRDELQRAIGPRIAQLTAMSPRRVVPLPQQVRDRIVEHRVVWIGNAAQTLHPVAGQGLNLGLRDALTLVDCLRSSRNDLPAALAHYARRRAGDRTVVRTLTRWMPPLFATRALPVAMARTLGLTAMDLLPPLRREWARLLMFGVRQ
jgi:2-octaprenyl-6-methoxyphenol hydroxylase